ncbi:MAG: class I SAM-dependent methyltransferase [Alicyclobacillaceae bacterium]|nr:class I SAM-dependent methyltransferase [Alicyclobacillaceae bacterium]
MADHYFTSRPGAPSDRKAIVMRVRGLEVPLMTDAGVFSRDRVDYGTRLLIGAMDVPEEGDVLDLGCGYGPIGIAAALLQPKVRVVMVDVNERAVELAKENARRLRLARVEVLYSDGFGALEGRTFDRVYCNPPIRAGKRVVYRLVAEAASHLKPGGQLWVVVQKRQGAESLNQELKRHFSDVEDVARGAGFRVYRCAEPVGSTGS